MTMGAPPPVDPDAELDALVGQMLGRLPKPLDWRRIPAHALAAEWATLDAWVRWLVTRYALDHRELPPCWYRHPAVVEELSALHNAHAGAFHPTQPPNGPLDWHQNLSYARQRLRDWSSRTGCKPGGHRDDAPAAWATDADADGYGTQIQRFVVEDEQARQDEELDEAMGM